MKPPQAQPIGPSVEDESRVLERLGAVLSADLDLKRIVQAATDAGRETSGADFGAFFIWDERGESYTPYTLSGAGVEDFDRFPMPRNTRIFASTLNGEGTLRLDDVTRDGRYGQHEPYHGMPLGHLPVRSYLAVSVVSRTGKVLGGLFYGHPQPAVFTERAQRLVEGIGRHAASAIDNAQLFEEVSRARAEAQAGAERLRTWSEGLEIEVRRRTGELEQQNVEVLRQAEQLRELSNRLLKIQDDERRHIARELHDSAGQNIVALGMNLAAVAKENPTVSRALEAAQNMVRQLSNEIRTTSYLLHPPLLDEIGLSQAIQWYVGGLKERSGLTVEFHIPGDFSRLSAGLELAIFRIVQECLTNIHRHSDSKTATIHISRNPGGISLEIQDQGKGISPERLAEIKVQRMSVGIAGMRERVLHFKGVMDIQSNETGTTVLVTFPIAYEPLPNFDDFPGARGN